MSAFDCSTKNHALGNRGHWSHDKVNDVDGDSDTIPRCTNREGSRVGGAEMPTPKKKTKKKKKGEHRLGRLVA